MKRRGNNEGSIHQRDNGRWRAQVSVGGRRLSSTHDTQKQARDWLRKTLTQVDQGLTYDANRTKMGEFLEAWLENKGTELRAATRQQYSWSARKYILPRLGGFKLKEITPERVQAFYNELRAEGTGARTIQIAHVLISSCLKHAARLGLVSRNPATYTIVPRSKPNQVVVWSEAELSQFLLSIQGHRNEILYYLAAVTGMRRGEVLGLRWADVDWLNQAIRVRWQVFEPEGGGFVFQEPKSELGKRAIEVGPGVIERLREQEQRVHITRMTAGGRWREYDLVFPSMVGTPQAGYNVSKDFRKLSEASGVRSIRLHDLRHTAASLMLSHGIPPVVVAGVLGHSLDILQKRYAHFIPSTQGQVASLMDSLTRPVKVSKSAP